MRFDGHEEGVSMVAISLREMSETLSITTTLSDPGDVWSLPRTPFLSRSERTTLLRRIEIDHPSASSITLSFASFSSQSVFRC